LTEHRPDRSPRVPPGRPASAQSAGRAELSVPGTRGRWGVDDL